MTGDEIMKGDLIDTNTSFLCGGLAELGWNVGRVVTLGDDPDALTAEIRTLARNFSVVIVNGGLGPTADDFTSQAIAAAFGVRLVENAEALSQLEEWVERRGFAMNDSNYKQALLPEGAFPLKNAVGSAPGLFFRGGNCEIFATPGVPSEMKAMWLREIKPSLTKRFSPPKSRTLVLRTFGLGESTLQMMISRSAPPPEGVALGFRASLPYVDVKLSFSEGREKEALIWRERLKSLFGQYLLAESSDDLNAIVHALLKRKGQTLAVAESCSGGGISALMTSQAGASEVFEGGIVVYNDRMKREVLGVDADLLSQYGAVSKETASAMVERLLEKTGADYGVATTGLAGPTGDGSQAPVGTLCIAWGKANQRDVRELLLKAPRTSFIKQATVIALDLTRRFLLGFDTGAPYVQDQLNRFRLENRESLRN